MHKFLGNIISKFDAEAKSHMERQSLNPFSGSFSRSPSPRLSKDQYGKPLAGSKTEERGQKAKCHILREILDLCNCIHDLGKYNKTRKQKDEDSDDEAAADEDEIIITFGEIFQMYTNINDKVVGLLIAAKKRGFLYFEKEILFQRRDDDVLIALIKPIAEIRAIITKELKINSSPVPIITRDESNAVSDSGMVNGNSSNGTINGSNKSSSSSPDKDVKKSKPKKSVENKNVAQTGDQNSNGTICDEKKSPEETNLAVEDIATQMQPNETDQVSSAPNIETEGSDLKEINTNLTPLIPNVSTSCQETNEQRNSGEEIKTVVPHQDAEQISITGDQPPSQFDSIHESGMSCTENIKSNAITTLELDEKSIPTIEISAAITPESNNNEEASEINQKDQNTVQDEKQISEIKTHDELANVQCDERNTTPTSENKLIQSENASTEKDKFPQTAETPAQEISLLVENEIQEPIDVNASNDRRRTISNEELIESLTAAISGRSSSPDPCDEEVEQILLSQASVSHIPFPEKIMEDERMIETSNSSQKISTPMTPSKTVDETLTPVSKADGESNHIDDGCSNTDIKENFVESDVLVESVLETNLTHSQIAIEADRAENTSSEHQEEIFKPILSSIESSDCIAPEVADEVSVPVEHYVSQNDDLIQNSNVDDSLVALEKIKLDAKPDATTETTQTI